MTSKDFMNFAAAQKGAIVTRESAYNNPEVLQKHPSYALHLQSLKISWFRPRTVRYAELQETIGLAVSRAFVGEMKTEEALKIAETDAAKITHSN